MNLNELEGYAVLDLETTGLKYDEGDRIIQIAIIRTDWDGNITSTWSHYVNPRRKMAAEHIHGISAKRVSGEPPFKELKESILQRIDNRVLVAHNYDFDGNFLATELSRIGYDFHPYKAPHLCTQKAGVDFLPHLASHRLAACLTDVGISFEGAGNGKHHDAEADAVATSKLLKHYIDLNKLKVEEIILKNALR
jgi:DNA polymerase III epsilon subunit-like protein